MFSYWHLLPPVSIGLGEVKYWLLNIHQGKNPWIRKRSRAWPHVIVIFVSFLCFSYPPEYCISKDFYICLTLMRMTAPSDQSSPQLPR